MTHPIEIIGGGLAGLSLGLALQRAGAVVMLYEAGAYPRHRVCGEFIAGLDPPTIARLGLEPILGDARNHRSVSWWFRGRQVGAERLPHPALGISRYVLDQRLADAFVTAGGTLRCHHRHPDTGPAPGRVNATGRVRSASPWFGLKVHARSFATLEDLEMHLGRGAYIGVTRVGEDEVNICGLFRRRHSSPEPQASPPVRGPAAFIRELVEHGAQHLGERLANAVLLPESFCAVAGLDFATKHRSVDDLAVGDAYSLIPPFTGNGMAIAFQSAAIALDPLLRYARGEQPWDATVAETNRLLRGRFARRVASANLVHPFLLRSRSQRWVAMLARTKLLPFRFLYAALH